MIGSHLAMMVCTLHLAAQPLVLVTNIPVVAGQTFLDFGPATFSAYRGATAPHPNTALSSANLAFLGIEGGANVNAVDDADGASGGADQERLRIAPDFGYALERLTWQWTRADGPLLTDGVRIGGFLSDPGAVFSGGLNAVSPAYTAGTLTFQVSSLNALIQTLSFTNPAATMGTALEITVADSTEAGPQFAMTSVTFASPAATVFASGFDGNTAPIGTADGTSGVFSLAVPWRKAGSVATISGLTAISTGDSGTTGGFIQMAGAPHLANSNNIFLSRNLNADSNTNTTRRGFSLTFTINTSIPLGTLAVLAGHATASGADQTAQSTLVYRLSGGTLTSPVSSASAEDYSNNPPHHTVRFDLTGATLGPGTYLLEVYQTSLVGGGAFAIYDGIALFAATTAPAPGTTNWQAVRNQTTNYPASTLAAAGLDPDGDPVAVSGVNPKSLCGGMVSLNSDVISYTPPTNYFGADEFSYTLSDHRGGSTLGTVRVTVVPQNEDFFRLTTPQIAGAGTVTLNFLGDPGEAYTLDWTTNLAAPILWKPVVTNAAGTNGWLTFTNTFQASQNYLRARHAPLPLPGTETRINGDFWFDTQGGKMDATELSVIKVGSYFYGFGSKRVLPTAYYDEIFKEFRCYRSTNLRDWEFRATALTAAEVNRGDTYSARCKVIHNAATGQYVMWFKLKDGNNDRGMGVAVSSSVEGPYTFLGKKYATPGQTGDISLFQEGANAYAVSSDVATRDIVIDKLTPDYLDVASHVYTIPANLEAPQLFKVGSRYYCIGSGVTGWDPNQSKYCSSTSLSGGWTGWANFGNYITYDSQGSDVFVINGTQATTAIFCADRWETPYLGNTTFVWLPIEINGSTASITYRDSFTIDPVTGAWGPGTAQIYKIINKHSGKALTVLPVDAGGNPLNRASNGADIAQWTYNASDEWSQWRVEGTTDGYKKIINKYSGRAMAVFDVRQDGFSPYSATNNTADICQFDYYDTDDKFKWKAQELGNGYRSIINKYSGKAAAVFSADAAGNPLSNTTDGADVAQYLFNGTQDWYHWQFLPLP